MIKIFKRYKLQEEKIKGLEATVQSLEAKLSDPREVVKAIIGQKLKVNDYERMDYNEKLFYYNEAKDSLKNETLRNEVRMIIDDQVDFIASRAKNSRELRDGQMIILAMDLLDKKLKGIYKPVNVSDEAEDTLSR